MRHPYSKRLISMTNHDHGIGAEPSWKSIEKILSAIVLDFLLIYSQALCYSTHIVVVNRLSAIYYYIVVLLLSNILLLWGPPVN